MILSFFRVLLFCSLSVAALAGFAETGVEAMISSNNSRLEEEQPAGAWQEEVRQLPDAPSEKNLLPFYVSASTRNRFFVDAASLSVGGDGVVRYTLIVLSPEGGRNVSFEGMRCETGERRIYASGRSNGAWSRSRNKQWSKIRDETSNRQYAALSLGYFCPEGVIARNVEEILGALKRDANFPGVMR